MPIEDDPAAECRLQPLPEPVAERAYAGHRREISNELAGHAKSGGEQDAFRTRTAPALVPRPVDERLQQGAATNIKRADSLWRIDFMTGNAEQVDTERVHIGGNLPDRLCSVGVEDNAALAGDAAHLDDGLDRPHLVVGMHDADEN